MEDNREEASLAQEECEQQAMDSESQTDVSPTVPDSTRGKESILRRVANMPLVSSTYDMAASAYNSTKNNHPYVKSLCDAAEKGVKTLTEAAVNSAQPILTKFEPQIVTANEYANKRLDMLQEKLPVLQMTAEQVASDTKKLVLDKMTSAKDIIDDIIFEVYFRMIEVKVTLGYNLNYTGDFSLSNLPSIGAEVFLGISERLVSKYLPITDLELLDLVANLPVRNGIPAQEHQIMFHEGDEFEVPLHNHIEVFVDHPREPEDLLTRFVSLSKKLRKRAYYHSLEKIQLAKRNIRESLFRLHNTIIKIERAKMDLGQKLRSAQETLSQMWQEWSQANSDTKAVKDEVEAQTLTMFQSIIQQLQAVCQSLVSSIQGLPSSQQDDDQQEPTNNLYAEDDDDEEDENE